MKIKYLFLLAAVILSTSTAMAQTLKVDDFHLDPSDLTAQVERVSDINGEPCALIRVAITVPHVSFEGDIVKVGYKGNAEYWVYMVAGATYLNIKTIDYLALRYEFPEALKGNSTYIMDIMRPDSESAKSISSTPKNKSAITWFVKAGVSLDNFTDLSTGERPTIGGDAVVGFQQPIFTSSFYWGMDLGMGTRGGSYSYENELGDEEKVTALAWGIRFVPLTVGYKLPLIDFISLDFHAGGFICYDLILNDTYYDDEFNKFDLGIQAGAGVWFGKFNIDVMYQRGFIDACASTYSSNVIIRLGLRF